MQIRLIRATFNLAVLLLALCTFAGTAVQADESLRIARPEKAERPENAARPERPEPPERRLPAGSEGANASEAPATSKTSEAPATSKTSETPATSKSSETSATSKTSATSDASCCGSSPCADTHASDHAALTNSLPSEGLYARWRNEFVNPTMCPIRLCHGSCARTSMGCKNIKTMIDSLLDAYIPEEQPIQAVLNFRCCAGFSDD